MIGGFLKSLEGKNGKNATSNRDPVLVLASSNANWALGSYYRWGSQRHLEATHWG